MSGICWTLTAWGKYQASLQTTRFPKPFQSIVIIYSTHQGCLCRPLVYCTSRSPFWENSAISRTRRAVSKQLWSLCPGTKPADEGWQLEHLLRGHPVLSLPSHTHTSFPRDTSHTRETTQASIKTGDLSRVSIDYDLKIRALRLTPSSANAVCLKRKKQTDKCVFVLCI